MRSILFILFFTILLPEINFGQQYFPFRDNGRWGMIDSTGKVIMEPRFQAIGSFNDGLAVFQINDQVGLIDKQGKEVLKADYQDIEVIDQGVYLVVENDQRKLLSDQGRMLVDKDVQEARMISDNIILFRLEQYWGAISRKGELIVPPFCEDVMIVENNYLEVKTKKGLGLWTVDGDKIADTIYHKIDILDDQWFAVRGSKGWGLLERNSETWLDCKWMNLQPVGTDYIQVQDTAGIALFVKSDKVLIAHGEYQRFIDFPGPQVMVLEDNLVGLIDHSGKVILPTIYNEIQLYEDQVFRVQQSKKWGLALAGNELLVPIRYDFIGPLNTSIAAVSRNRKFGLINFLGELVHELEFDRVEIADNTVQAYRGESLEVLAFTDEGQMAGQDSYQNFGTISIGYRAERVRRGLRSTPQANPNPRQMDDFEWFYHADADKWGLRKKADGKIIIPPTYDNIEVKRDLGFTVVGNEAIDKFQFDRTVYSFYMVYGIIDNKRGLPITPMNLIDIRFNDLERDSLPVARVIFRGGRHGLINDRGAIIAENYAYIGNFIEGKARMSQAGRLSTKMMESGEHLGLINTYLNKFRSNAQLESLTQFDKQIEKEGKLICEECKWGFLDTLSQISIKPAYTFIHDFRNGIALTQLEKQWGAIDHQGQKVLDIAYDRINYIENSDDQMLRIFQFEPKYGMIDSSGKVIVPILYDEVRTISQDRIAVRRGNRWGFLDKKGNEITPIHFEKVKDFSEDLAAVRKNRRWGFINRSGEVVLDFQYRDAGSFSSGKAWVRPLSKIGYIDKSGTEVIEAKFSKGFDFEGSVARVRDGSLYGLINESGQYICKPKYIKIGFFDSAGQAIVSIKGGGFSVIDHSGQRISNRKFQKIESFSDDLALVRDNSKYGFINRSGDLVIPANLQRAESFSNGRAAFQEKGRWGFIDETGNVIVHAQYSKCLSFDDGFAVVYQGYQRSGLIDLTGEEIIKPSVDRILSFSTGRGLVRTPSYKYYFITKQNRLYKGYFQGAEGFQNHAAPVKFSGRWGLINSNGMELISPKFDKVYPFENGFAKVRIKAFSGVSDLQGNIIIPPNYELINYAGEGLFRVEKGNSIGYLNTEGEWVLNLKQ